MLFNIELLTHVGQVVIGELLTTVRKKNFKCAMFKYKFLENGISYSCGLLIWYGLCNGPSGEMIHHHQYIPVVVVRGRSFHNQVSRYLGKSSPWYLHDLQLILVSMQLLLSTQGTAVYMGLYVLYHFRPVVVSFDQGISFLNAKMTEVFMHLLEDGFYEGFRDNCGFIFLAVFPVYVI